MKVFVAHVAHPSEDCAAASVVVAAASRIDAVGAFPSAGLSARDLKLAADGSSPERAGLQGPGVVLRSEWAAEHDEREWHRQR